MAFTRKALKAMGLTDEQIDSLIELHTESTDAIKADRDKYKEEAEKLPDVQRQLKEAESKIEAAEKDDYKGKYESEKAAHEKLKGEIATKETAANRLKGFKEEAKKRGYGEEAIKTFLDSKSHDPMERIKYDDDGKATNLDDVFKGLDEAFPKHKVISGTDNFKPNIPAESGSSKPVSDIAARMQKFNAKYNADHYGVKADSGTAAKEE